MPPDLYGLVTFADSLNIGDEIQTIAAERFLPRVDCEMDREALDRMPRGNLIKTILSGWYMHDPRNWPPSPTIHPLIVSIHIAQARRGLWPWIPTAAALMLKAEGRRYLSAHAPVGARDVPTLELLRAHGIEAYLSGCLTLTFPRAEQERAGVVACDVPERLLPIVEARSGSVPLVVSHLLDRPLPSAERRGDALRLLDLYARARLVVTSRVHCALPCLALGTPVLYVPSPRERERQSLAIQLTHCASARDVRRGKFDYDLQYPPPNPIAYQDLANGLVRRCTAFVNTPQGPDRSSG